MKFDRADQKRTTFFNGIPEYYRDIKNWPAVTPATVTSKDDRQRLINLTKAATWFLERKPFKDVLKVAGVGERQFFVLMKTALAPAKKGDTINGTRAFQRCAVQPPRKRVQPFVPATTDKAGFGGMFSMLLAERPQIEEDLVDFLNGKERPNKVTPHILHVKFLRVCTANGVPQSDYPFNTKKQGYQSLMKWMNEVYIPNHLSKHLKNQHGPAAATAATYELGDGESKTPPMPYVAWVLDEFKVDLGTVVELPLAAWDVEYVALGQYQCLRLRAIGPVACNIAWHLVLRRQAAGTDVIQLMRNGILGQPAVEIVEPTMAYMDGAGFPQNLFPRLKYAVPILVYLDNALSHLFNPLQNLLTRVCGARVKLGVPGQPKGRPEIESAISNFLRNYIHQLPGTTGSGPGDPLREQAAVEPAKRVQIGLLEQAIDVFVANENVATSAGAGYLASFTRLKRLLETKQLLPNYLPETKRLPHHFSEPEPVRVTSEHADGRLAFVRFKDRRYSSPWLKKQPVIRQELWALCDYQDLRKIVLVDSSGAHFATLTKQGEWAYLPHDMRVLQIVAKRRADAEHKERPGDSPLFATLKHLEDRARGGETTAATEYAYIMRYLKKMLDPRQLDEVKAGALLEGDLDVIDVPSKFLADPIPLASASSPALSAPTGEVVKSATVLTPVVQLVPRINVPRRLG